jgi:hypothetical protein
MDYKRCLINIDLSEKDVEDAFVSLHPNLDELIGEIRASIKVPIISIIKFIVSCYDRESPLVMTFRSQWMKKKREAAILAAFPRDGERYTDDAEAIILGKRHLTNKLIVRYLSLLHDNDFNMYAMYNEAKLGQSMELINSGFDSPGNAEKASANIERWSEKIQELEKTIFEGDDVRALRIALYEEAHRKISDLRPENLVDRMERGEKLVDSPPYGKDYTEDKLRFVGDE